MPLSLGNIILLKEKGGGGGEVNESQFLGRLLRSLGSSKKRERSGVLEEEIGAWSSQGGEKSKHFFT